MGTLTLRWRAHARDLLGGMGYALARRRAAFLALSSISTSKVEVFGDLCSPEPSFVLTHCPDVGGLISRIRDGGLSCIAALKCFDASSLGLPLNQCDVEDFRLMLESSERFLSLRRPKVEGSVRSGAPGIINIQVWPAGPDVPG
ncbi:hypothetical protein EVAR_12141_1 [Eumeta japonica]|uniref:Uncharacterized protein n=1 Tax=Eumeta variegata TaxID=151549 RepID=A0A4C1UIE8_EUMVA|nr:hypothetical protein EVAR_12141_1 [Eumeta japonica]